MRFTYRAAGPLAAAVVLTLVAACSRTQQDWRIAQQANTAGSYNVFVQRHPDSELASVARQRMAQLTEQAAWQRATRANTAAAYRDYLTKYPDGSWSQDARIRMESRSLAAQPPPGAGAITSGVVVSERTTAQTGVAVAAPASADYAVSGNSTVQLGAFSSAANARRAWSQLASRFRAELAGLTPLVVPVSLSGRQLYRLETHAGDQTAARRLCRQLTQQSQGCLPVP